MKIAAVTNDGKTISQHFGRATKYAVLTVENGTITGRELRDKVGHQQFAQEGQGGGHHHGQDDDHGHGEGHGFGHHAEEKHHRMFATITDCDVLLARGMGRGAYMGLQQTGVKPVVTDIADIEQAAQAVIDGTIVDFTERLH
jgi:predicted Fe-Mo cluster-binding NifX family protein